MKHSKYTLDRYLVPFRNVTSFPNREVRRISALRERANCMELLLIVHFFFFVFFSCLTIIRVCARTQTLKREIQKEIRTVSLG